jgi:hypothetical protein
MAKRYMSAFWGDADLGEQLGYAAFSPKLVRCGWSA